MSPKIWFLTMAAIAMFLMVEPRLSVRLRRSDDVSPDRVELDQLANQVAQLQAGLTSQQHEIDQLKAERAKRVAFAAYISKEPTLAASAGTTVMFGGVMTNVGSAYNSATSVFTAPFDGDYMFFVRVDISKDCDGVIINLNGHTKAIAQNDFHAGSHVSAGVTLTLKTGDVVHVTFVSTHGYVDSGVESMFTGFRLA